jgi:hypothetical protein
MNTPVLFIIFNRPENTRRVFEVICKIKPKRLFIAADGPREKKPEEKSLCEQVRRITAQIDWDCELKTLFRDKNLGCKIAVSSAIDWFFDNVNEGIILEDDCLPDKTFFSFCGEMLNKYKDNGEVMHISGTNFQEGGVYGDGSYFFSSIGNIWGWATWKRAWKLYDREMTELDNFISSKKINKYFKNRKYQNYWVRLFEIIKNKKVDTWDAQWQFCIYNNGGFCITPNKNLISNIGFGVNATHTTEKSPDANLSLQQIGNLISPSNQEVSQDADDYVMKKRVIPLAQKVFNRVIFLINKLIIKK